MTTKTKTVKTGTLAIAAAIAATLLPAAANADAPRTELTRQVAFGDLDLASSAGRSHLDTRIAVAVRNLCGSVDPRALSQAADVRRCRQEAMATAIHGRDLAIADSTRHTGVAMMTVVSPTLGH